MKLQAKEKLAKVFNAKNGITTGSAILGGSAAACPLPFTEFALHFQTASLGPAAWAVVGVSAVVGAVVGAIGGRKHFAPHF